MIIDGKKIAHSDFEHLKKEIETYGYTPTLLAFLVGNSAESLRYIKQKKKWAEKIGIQFILKKFEINTTQIQLVNEIKLANTDNQIDGIIVQLPLPKTFQVQKVIESISASKDVDGFTPTNQGKCVIADTSGFIPCTPAGVMQLIHSYFSNLEAKNIVIIGRSNIVGKPLANLCINAGATVSVCNSSTRDISYYTKNADIVISATGKPHLIRANMLGEKTLVIDVGFSVIDGKIFGDCDFGEIEHRGHTITPVPGGVGPMTVLNLMKNTVQAHKNLHKVGGNI